MKDHPVINLMPLTLPCWFPELHPDRGFNCTLFWCAAGRSRREAAPPQSCVFLVSAFQILGFRDVFKTPPCLLGAPFGGDAKGGTSKSFWSLFSCAAVWECRISPGKGVQAAGEKLGWWFPVSAAGYELLWPVWAAALTVVWCLHTWSDRSRLDSLSSHPQLCCRTTERGVKGA